jgi:hypothetical protein
MGTGRSASRLSMFATALGALVIFALFSLTGSFAGEERKAKRKPAATPEEAVKQLAEAANAEDYNGVLATFAKEPRESEQALWSATDDLVKAQWRLHDAINERFGKDPNEGPKPDLKAIGDQSRKNRAGSFRKATVLSKKVRTDGSIELRTRFTPSWKGEDNPREETVIAVHERDGWKLIPPRFNPEEDNSFIEFLRKQQAGYEQVGKRVKEGKYQSRDEAERSMAQAQVEAAQAMLKKLGGKLKKP